MRACERVYKKLEGSAYTYNSDWDICKTCDGGHGSVRELAGHLSASLAFDRGLIGEFCWERVTSALP